jgi:hypothetical protein
VCLVAGAVSCLVRAALQKASDSKGTINKHIVVANADAEAWSKVMSSKLAGR